ncbi:M35 family metallo-endopeptidase [Cupriavidus sp.]|uniref:M35 family metallo-endopeptidase n=2 Tax=unclassified Cupriavidus TaxID=2640874 RepID=UPI0028BD1F29|nr:M35 family metallo-endopeptidase [Cupriavidus sp.]
MMRNDKRHMLDGASRTSTGGWLIATSDSTNMGKRLGLEGDHGTCPACKVGGPVYNDCDPRWTDMGKSVLVEGARVYCQCKEKPRVFASQFTMSSEVVSGNVSVAAAGADSKMPYTHNNLASRTTTPDAASLAAYEADPTMICPNMTNAEFYAAVMRVRDIAVAHMEARLMELARWSESDKDKVRIWFTNATPDIRKRLREGITRIRKISLSLTEKNFERFSEEAVRRVGCVPAAGKGDEPAWASVCKSDKTFAIFIGTTFCYLHEEKRNYQGIIENVSSMTTVFIHEVSHFPAAMDTVDRYSGIKAARLLAKLRNRFVIENADNIAAYVADVPNW